VTPEEVVDVLEQRELRPKRTGPGKWESRCPAHDDRQPSLSISLGAGDRVLLHCHAGCPVEDVLASLGLTTADLFASANGDGASLPGEEYVYVDERGAPVMKVVRRPGKKFAQARPDGSGSWVWNLRGVKRVVYRLPKVLAAVATGETVYVCEGEKDVHALERAGVIATTNPGGAGKWSESYSRALARADVVVIADRDKSGRAHALAVAESLRGQDCTVRVVEAATGKDAHDHLSAGLSIEDFRAPGEDEQPAVASAPDTPASALERSRVDIVLMIREGIPPREYVPGAPELLPKGKRIHIAAERKTGKSLSIAVVTALQIVVAGGTVVVLDRENGADEYARRLRDVLEARDADDSFRERVRERLRYHAWPTLSLDWRDGYSEAFDGVDVVIFDSSRSHLTPLGLKEDLSDDFAAFTTALIDPLMQAAITTVILDNAGHVEKDRPRGTSSKGDLCDIAFTMRTLSPFSSTLAGRLELRCTDSRIGEISGTWHMELGDGCYGDWQKIGAHPLEARDELRDAAVEVLAAASETLGSEKIGKAIRVRPGNTLKFAAGDLRAGLAAWAADPTSGVLPGPSGKGYTAHVGQLNMASLSRHGRHALTRESPDTAHTPTTTGDTPMSDPPDTTRHEGHVAGRPPYGGDTADTHPSENEHESLPDGWSLSNLETTAAKYAEEATR